MSYRATVSPILFAFAAASTSRQGADNSADATLIPNRPKKTVRTDVVSSDGRDMLPKGYSRVHRSDPRRKTSTRAAAQSIIAVPAFRTQASTRPNPNHSSKR
jgi:hypothetical protein